MGDQLGYTVLNLNGDKPNYQTVEPIRWFQSESYKKFDLS